MTLIADIVNRVTANPAPVLFLDTCILLDVVRAPMRHSPDEVRVAQQLRTSIGKSPKTIYLVVGSPTQKEWNDNIDDTMKECDQAVNSCNDVVSICGHMGLPAVAPFASRPPALAGILRKLSSGLLGAAMATDHHADALGRAIDRVIGSIIPAKRGGRGAKDAVILEHVVQTTTELRAAGFGGTCVFVSSNTTDFAASGTSSPHPLLVPIFAPINLEYATNLTHAEAKLLSAGWAP
jgi:hypothetical protein